MADGSLGQGFYQYFDPALPGDDAERLGDGAEALTTLVVNYHVPPHISIGLDGSEAEYEYTLPRGFSYVSDAGDVYGVRFGEDGSQDFATDLVSVPQLFTWLVPAMGRHLRAVLLHDALVVGAEPSDAPRSRAAEWVSAVLAGTLSVAVLLVLLWPRWTLVSALLLVPIGFLALTTPMPSTPVESHRTHSGPAVHRLAADDLLREAMLFDGVRIVRAWIIWATVVLATLWTAPLLSVADKWRWRVLIALTLGGTAVIGVFATLDVFDVADRAWIPWMGDRPLGQELALGALGALVLPLLVSMLWRSRWRAAAIASVTLAFLLHVTAVIALVYLLYILAERLFGRAAP